MLTMHTTYTPKRPRNPQVKNSDAKGLAGAKKIWDHMRTKTAKKCAHIARGEVRLFVLMFVCTSTPRWLFGHPCARA